MSFANASDRIYASLRDQLLSSYSIHPAGPIIMNENPRPLDVGKELIFADRQGNVLYLDYFAPFGEIKLHYYARGSLSASIWSPVKASFCR